MKNYGKLFLLVSFTLLFTLNLRAAFSSYPGSQDDMAYLKEAGVAETKKDLFLQNLQREIEDLWAKTSLHQFGRIRKNLYQVILEAQRTKSSVKSIFYPFLPLMPTGSKRAEVKEKFAKVRAKELGLYMDLENFVNRVHIKSRRRYHLKKNLQTVDLLFSRIQKLLASTRKISDKV